MKTLLTIFALTFSVSAFAQFGAVQFPPSVDWDLMNQTAAKKEARALAAAQNSYGDVFGSASTAHWRGFNSVVVKSNDGCKLGVKVKGNKVKLAWNYRNGPVCN